MNILFNSKSLSCHFRKVCIEYALDISFEYSDRTFLMVGDPPSLAFVTVSLLIVGMQGKRSAQSSDLHDRKVLGDTDTRSSPRWRELVFELVFLTHGVWFLVLVTASLQQCQPFSLAWTSISRLKTHCLLINFFSPLCYALVNKQIFHLLPLQFPLPPHRDRPLPCDPYDRWYWSSSVILPVENI